MAVTESHVQCGYNCRVWSFKEDAVTQSHTLPCPNSWHRSNNRFFGSGKDATLFYPPAMHWICAATMLNAHLSREETSTSITYKTALPKIPDKIRYSINIKILRVKSNSWKCHDEKITHAGRCLSRRSVSPCLLVIQRREKENAEVTDTAFDFIADRFGTYRCFVTKWMVSMNFLLPQKELANTILYQASLCGRDIFYDQIPSWIAGKKNRGKLYWKVIQEKNPEPTGINLWCMPSGCFRQWNSSPLFSWQNVPECSKEYFAELLAKSDPSKLPLEGMALPEFTTTIQQIVFWSDYGCKIR